METCGRTSGRYCSKPSKPPQQVSKKVSTDLTNSNKHTPCLGHFCFMFVLFGTFYDFPTWTTSHSRSNTRRASHLHLTEWFRKKMLCFWEISHTKNTQKHDEIYTWYIYIYIYNYIYIHTQYIYMYIYYIYVHILYHIYILYTCICILCIYIYIHIIIILYIWLIIYDRYLELNGLREVVELNSVNCGNSMRSE